MVTVDVADQIRAARERAGMTQRELARRSGVPQPHISAIESGRVTPTSPMVERLLAAARMRPSRLLDRYREQVRAIVTSHGGSDPRVFGSVARGDDTEDSDIDLLVSFPPGTTIFDLAALTNDLEDLLGRHVDVVGDSGRSRALRRARREAVPV
jgi:hypothetical protein